MTTTHSSATHAFHEADWKKNCGARLRKARRELQLDMKDIHARIGIPISTLSSYERGARALSVPVARELAACLNISTAWLLCVEDTLGHTVEESQWLLAMREAAPVARKTALDVLALRTHGRSRAKPH